MRRTTFVALGILEILGAGVLFVFVWLLPGPSDVHDKVGRIERVSRQTGSQVRKLRDEVRRLRYTQPHARQVADDLRVQLAYLGDQLERQRLDYATVNALYQSFGSVALGLDEMCNRLTPDGVILAAQALGGTADFLAAVGADPAADLLRRGRAEVDKVVARWPEIRHSLRGSAELLRATQQQLRFVLDNRAVYDGSLQQTRVLLDGLSAAVPMYTEQWGNDLADQERSLSNLGASIDEVSAVMPEVKTVGSRLLVMTRLLLSLVGAIFLLHGGYLAVGTWWQHTTLEPRT